MWRELKGAALLALVPGIAGFLGCGMDDPVAPALQGPSELGLSIELRAIPDQLTADGFSSSVIEAVVRNASGNRVGADAVTVIFDITQVGTGAFFDLGNIAPLDSPRPLPGGEEARQVSVSTDGSGVARARYWAPFRTDQENDTTVTVTARPAGTDFRAAVFRQVDIFLRAANRPLFPGATNFSCDPAADPPVSDAIGQEIIVEPQQAAYPIGQQVFFHARTNLGPSGQPIARYEWEIEDGAQVFRFVGREANHVWINAGNWTVRLFITESVTGIQCFDTVGILVF